MRCSGRWLVEYGDYVEVYSEKSGELLASFRVIRDMCKETFDTYVRIRYGVEVPYKIKKLRTR